ncbi:MAG: hypothetical protein G01um101418_814 [Parcubacteria group bacterium Gr01-1014_18]|nr:MAG: hypothetical protein Greene041636_696 [Parcubacteria group bacterium Greene0416_36]TSC80116.1 MAG: hypothetical protein G01um101418_814 [Parcubacteria group bacterium Gr01-1014_18]TSC98594.1 MAG: hypothetical protein Greene101420_646 [Parcubacteria group bacterium Greene1014_20]TSD06421.1 MAG: hypothetical protein Greene07142_912 [Parcubacteria group bacterium Greene0714_2]
MIGGIIFALLFSSGGYGVWAMARPLELPLPQTTLAVYSGSVYIRHSGQNVWLEAKNNAVLLQGDTVKTALDGEAAINFFDSGISRLDRDSQITLRKLFIDSQSRNKINIEYEFDFGRIWSRLLNLLDRDSSYTLTAGDTVATIRGTAFWAERPKALSDLGLGAPSSNGKISLGLYEGSMGIASSRLPEIIAMTAGQKANLPVDTLAVKPRIEVMEWEKPAAPDIAPKMAQFLHEQKMEKAGFSMEKITPAEKESAWLQENLIKDTQYTEEVKVKKEENLRDIAGILPDSPLYPAKRAMQAIVLAVVDDERREEKEMDFWTQKMASSAVLFTENENILASKIMEEAKTEMEEKSALVEREPEMVEKKMFLVMDNLKGTLPDTESFEVKTQLASLIVSSAREEKQAQRREEFEKLEEKDLKNLLLEEKWDNAREFLEKIESRLDEAEKTKILDELPINDTKTIDQLRTLPILPIEKLERKMEEKLPLAERRADIVNEKEGSKEETLPDGTLRRVDSDGTIEKTLPDSRRETITPDGRIIRTSPEGQTTERREVPSATTEDIQSVDTLPPETLFIPEKEEIRPTSIGELSPTTTATIEEQIKINGDTKIKIISAFLLESQATPYLSRYLMEKYGNMEVLRMNLEKIQDQQLLEGQIQILKTLAQERDQNYTLEKKTILENFNQLLNGDLLTQKYLGAQNLRPEAMMEKINTLATLKEINIFIDQFNISVRMWNQENMNQTNNTQKDQILAQFTDTYNQDGFFRGIVNLKFSSLSALLEKMRALNDGGLIQGNLDNLKREAILSRDNKINGFILEASGSEILTFYGKKIYSTLENLRNQMMTLKDPESLENFIRDFREKASQSFVLENLIPPSTTETPQNTTTDPLRTLTNTNPQ